MTGQRSPWFWWLLWTLIGAGLLLPLAQDEGILAALTPAGWVSLVLSTAPLIGAQLALGAPGVAARVRDWLQNASHPLWCTAGGLSGLYLLGNLLAGGFDPYATAIFIVGAFAALGTLREIRRGQAGLTWTDAAVWLFLWIPFDLRWNYDLWQGVEGMRYNWWAIALTVTGVIGWYALRDLPEFGYRLTPRTRDVVVALIHTVVFAAIVIPIGLAIDFLRFPPSEPLRLLPVLAHFVGIFLTVALPEELFFRGVLLHGLDQMSRRRWLTLLISSLAFGLMHWNNAGDLTTRIAYTALATLAGVFYGSAYRRSGNNLLAPALTHTLVDVIWRFVFQ